MWSCLYTLRDGKRLATLTGAKILQFLIYSEMSNIFLRQTNVLSSQGSRTCFIRID